MLASADGAVPGPWITCRMARGRMTERRERSMTSLTWDLLRSATTAGGPSVLVSTTALAPAGGPQASVAPARYVSGRPGSDTATYAYEVRFIDGEPRHVVILDSKQSQLNRAESALQQAIWDGVDPLVRVPQVRVTYARDGIDEVYTDLTLPHRAYDGHVRAGTVDGVPVTQTETYRAARDATPANARALLEFSPITLVYGGWDATRRSRQGRWRSALVGEIVGVVADEAADPRHQPLRGGARVDPVAMQVQLSRDALIALATAQEDELSPALYKKIVNAAKKSDSASSGSTLGLGGIPPTLNQLAGVACSQIIRTHVLSLATLRQIRFGAGPDGDAACRALLAALALNGLARSDAELFLRANCDLVETGPTTVTIDRRGGDHEALAPLTIPEADALLASAIDAASREAGIDWHGQVFAVTGNPDIISSAVDATEEA
jgi:CRISPR-associated protein Csb1